MDDLADIRELYNAGWDREDSRLERHQLERDITWRYLDAHLPKAGQLLEVGIGAGHYTFELARRGYEITGVDLAEELVARCKRRAIELGLANRVQLKTADARELGGLPDSEFDALLLMGPLYHLVAEEDRQRAIRRAYACLKPGGVLFSALISRFGIIGDRLKRRPSWVEDHAEVRSIIEHGHRRTSVPKGGFRGYYAHADEVAPMHESAGFDTVVVAGTEPAISADDDSYNRLEGEQRHRWLNLLFEVSAEPSMVASSRHLLYIGRRPAASPGRSRRQ